MFISVLLESSTWTIARYCFDKCWVSNVKDDNNSSICIVLTGSSIYINLLIPLSLVAMIQLNFNLTLACTILPYCLLIFAGYSWVAHMSFYMESKLHSKCIRTLSKFSICELCHKHEEEPQNFAQHAQILLKNFVQCACVFAKGFGYIIIFILTDT